MFTPSKPAIFTDSRQNTHYKQIIMKKQNNSKYRRRTVWLLHIRSDGFEAGNHPINLFFGELLRRLYIAVVVARKHDVSEAIARNWVIINDAAPRQRKALKFLGWLVEVAQRLRKWAHRQPLVGGVDDELRSVVAVVCY